MRRSWFLALLIALGVIAWMVSGAFLPAQDAASQAGAGAAERQPPTVRVMEMRAEPRASALILQGRTAASRAVDIRAEIAGTVTDLLVQRGSVVEQGDPLLRLDEADRAARLAEAEALVRQRETEFNAASRLNQQGFRSDTNVAEAEAALDSARAQLEVARLNVEQMEITAPFRGVVDSRPVERGAYVSPGETVATLVDLDPLVVEGQVSERYLGEVDLGALADVRFVDGTRAQGVVSYIGRVANEATRTFPVEIEVPNPDGRIIAGLTAEIHLPTERLMAHRLPPSIVSVSDEGEVGVFTLDSESRARFTPVEIVGGVGAVFWVTGLEDAADVIVVGQGFVQDGTLVEATRVDAIPNRLQATSSGREPPP